MPRTLPRPHSLQRTPHIAHGHSAKAGFRTRPGTGGLALALLLVFMSGCGASSPGVHGGAAAPAPLASPGPPEDGASAGEAVWRLFDASGSAVELDVLIAASASVEAILVGERHGDPGGHRFQSDLFESMVRDAGRPLVLSLEMFERDVQPILDEYLLGLITEEHFLAASRPWNSYRRDYRPMVELAREEGIPVLAANAPRRYVNRVSRIGREALADLPSSALEHLPPLPYPGPSEAYRAEWDALMAEMMAAAGGHPSAHAMGDGALQAQALWDASMAHSVARALERESGGALVIHLTGAFHVENRTGTPEALEHYRPGTRSLVVVIHPVEDPDLGPSADQLRSGDFVVLTRTPGSGPGA